MMMREVTNEAETWKFNKHLESEFMTMEMDFWEYWRDDKDQKKEQKLFYKKKTLTIIIRCLII